MDFKLIDHIGIAVNSIEESVKVWEALGFKLHGIEEVTEQKVKTAFLPAGDLGCEIELLEGTSEDSAISKHIAKKGQGIQHVAIRVANIEEALAELKAKGIRLIDETPRIGAGGAKIAFIHPKESTGTLLELCQRD